MAAFQDAVEHGYGYVETDVHATRDGVLVAFHDDRLDRAAAQVGLERIRPLGAALPALNPARISMADVSKVFTVIPFGADMSLMPERIRALPSL